jgi:hypothetical protein
MEDIVSGAKENFTRAKDRMVKVLAETPDDRINWSPTETARTPVQLVAHAAAALGSITDFCSGRPVNLPDTGGADKKFREWEKQCTSREEALALLEKNSAAHVALLDSLTPDSFAKMVQLPFGMGEVPLAAVITVGGDHTRFHCAQLEYVQTIYGDRDWHM